jgi:hypothetical protein
VYAAGRTAHNLSQSEKPVAAGLLGRSSQIAPLYCWYDSFYKLNYGRAASLAAVEDEVYV